MAENKDLVTVLWSGADVLRGKMDANEYKTYLLGLVFYKYLSDTYLKKAYDLMENEDPESMEAAQAAYEEVMGSDDAQALKEERILLYKVIQLQRRFQFLNYGSGLLITRRKQFLAIIKHT